MSLITADNFEIHFKVATLMCEVALYLSHQNQKLQQTSSLYISPVQMDFHRYTMLSATEVN